jgi:hypothetical protein
MGSWDMINKRKLGLLGLLCLLAFFWAYSFSTRIGLFFLVPMWLKIIILGTLTANFWLFGYLLIKNINQNFLKPKTIFGVVAISIFLCSFIFIVLPYQRVPFRTTHHLEITALSSEVKIRAVLSPDNNLVERDAFNVDGKVEDFFHTGFRVPPGSTINYHGSHTGKLSIILTADSGSVLINWDGIEKSVNPSDYQGIDQIKLNQFQIFEKPDTKDIEIRLPGNTWGEPDLFWAILGGLLPISDFISLTSFLLVLMLLVALKLQGFKAVLMQSALITPWVDFLLCIALMMLLLNIGFPDFVPFWLLFFFLPAVTYLAYSQLRFLNKSGIFNCKGLTKITQLIEKVKLFINALNRDQRLLWLALIAVGLIGSLVQLHMTAPGMIISGDSVHYMEGARNLALGKGYVLNITYGDPDVITGFDPGYSLSLVPGILLGHDVQHVARILNAFLFFLTLILTGWIIYLTTDKVLPALITNLFLIMAPIIISIYSFVMSEPLFIVFLLSAFLSWLYYIKTSSIWKLVISGVFGSLMIVTRFASIVFLPVLLLGTIIFGDKKIKQRLLDAVILGCITLVAPVIFFIRNKLVTETSPVTKGVRLVPFTQENWEVIGEELSSWFKWQAYFNDDYQKFNAVFISLGVILVLFIVWFIFRKTLKVKDKSDSFVIMVFFSILIYFSSIILNSMTADPAPTPGGIVRYMIPLFILLIILVAKLLSVYWKKPYLTSKILILFIALVGLHLYQVDFIDLINQPPLAYRHYTFRKNMCNDEVLDILASISTTTYYTNNCEYFYFMTNQQCYPLTFDQTAYEPGGEVYQALEQGSVIANSEGFGSNPPGIQKFLNQLHNFDSACYLTFYRWQD